MVRGLKRSLIMRSYASAPNQPLDAPSQGGQDGGAALPPFQKMAGGAGSAWKAGALAEIQAGFDEARENLAKSIMLGDQIIEIDPGMIIDPVGTDRREDWKEQEAFQSFVDSIRKNGQHVPVLVWPEDKNWRPDKINPEKIEHVQFLLLAGRRRCEAARRLGIPVRAVLVSQEGRDDSDSLFNMLVLRFRENEDRENLSAFERLVSIGQMYEELSRLSPKKLRAKDFAQRVGIHESLVSRARSVCKFKAPILEQYPNVYSMSFNDIQKLLSRLIKEEGTLALNKKNVLSPPPVKKMIKVQRRFGNSSLSLRSGGGNLSITTRGVHLDKNTLERLGDLIANYLDNKKADESHME